MRERGNGELRDQTAFIEVTDRTRSITSSQSATSGITQIRPSVAGRGLGKLTISTFLVIRADGMVSVQISVVDGSARL
jgi:hypothetical protein